MMRSLPFQPAIPAILFFLLVINSPIFPRPEVPEPKPDSQGSERQLRTPEGKRICRTRRLESSPPGIDGKLDDSCWEEGAWSGEYLQFMPEEGAPPTQQTELKILYDESNIYVAIRAYDTEPDKIDRHLGRRDDFEGDIVGVCFDSYFDRRTGFEFDLTAGGAKIDLLLRNDGWDTSWDAVWYGAVGMETSPSAWTAEMQIPLNQLRWEFKPGSVFYFVWTQGRMEYEGLAEYSLRQNFRDLFSSPADNVLLVKFSCWFPF